MSDQKVEVTLNGKKYWYHHQMEKAVKDWIDKEEEAIFDIDLIKEMNAYAKKMHKEDLLKKYPLTEKQAFPKPGELYECGKQEIPEAKKEVFGSSIKETFELRKQQKDKSIITQMAKLQEKKDYRLDEFGVTLKDEKKEYPHAHALSNKYSVVAEMKKLQEKKDDLHYRMQQIIAKGGRPVGKPTLFGTGGDIDAQSSEQMKKLFHNPGEAPFKWHEMPEPKYSNHSLFLDMGASNGTDFDADKVLKMYKEAGVMMFKEESFSQRNGYMFGSYPRKMLLLL